MATISRVLLGVVPFALIGGVFAAAVARHLAEPTEPAARFDWLVAHPDVALPPVGPDDFVAVARSACTTGAPCRRYEARILASGRVEFVDGGDVDPPSCGAGPVHAGAMPAQARRLVAALRAAGAAEPAAVAASGVPADGVRLGVGGALRDVREPALAAAAAAAADRVAGTLRLLEFARTMPPRCATPGA